MATLAAIAPNREYTPEVLPAGTAAGLARIGADTMKAVGQERWLTDLSPSNVSAVVTSGMARGNQYAEQRGVSLVFKGGFLDRPQDVYLMDCRGREICIGSLDPRKDSQRLYSPDELAAQLKQAIDTCIADPAAGLLREATRETVKDVLEMWRDLRQAGDKAAVEQAKARIAPYLREMGAGLTYRHPFETAAADYIKANPELAQEASRALAGLKAAVDRGESPVSSYEVHAVFNRFRDDYCRAGSAQERAQLVEKSSAGFKETLSSGRAREYQQIISDEKWLDYARHDGSRFSAALKQELLANFQRALNSVPLSQADSQQRRLELSDRLEQAGSQTCSEARAESVRMTADDQRSLALAADYPLFNEYLAIAGLPREQRGKELARLAGEYRAAGSEFKEQLKSSMDVRGQGAAAFRALVDGDLRGELQARARDRLVDHPSASLTEARHGSVLLGESDQMKCASHFASESLEEYRKLMGAAPPEREQRLAQLGREYAKAGVKFKEQLIDAASRPGSPLSESGRAAFVALVRGTESEGRLSAAYVQELEIDRSKKELTELGNQIGQLRYDPRRAELLLAQARRALASFDGNPELGKALDDNLATSSFLEQSEAELARIEQLQDPEKRRAGLAALRAEYEAIPEQMRAALLEAARRSGRSYEFQHTAAMIRGDYDRLVREEEAAARSLAEERNRSERLQKVVAGELARQEQDRQLGRVSKPLDLSEARRLLKDARKVDEQVKEALWREYGQISALPSPQREDQLKTLRGQYEEVNAEVLISLKGSYPGAFGEFFKERVEVEARLQREQNLNLAEQAIDEVTKLSEQRRIENIDESKMHDALRKARTAIAQVADHEEQRLLALDYDLSKECDLEFRRYRTQNQLEKLDQLAKEYRETHAAFRRQLAARSGREFEDFLRNVE